MFTINYLIESRIVDGIAAWILLSTIAILSSTRIGASIRYYAAQSILLGILTLAVYLFTGIAHILIAAVLTIVVKGFILPYLMFRVLNRLHIKRDVEMRLGIPYLLIISVIFIIIAYAATNPIRGLGQLHTHHTLPIAIGIVLIGLLIMISRTKALTQLLGLVTMENGLFLAGLSVTYGMPLIVELGIFFDLLIGVFIMGIFILRIERSIPRAHRRA